MIVTSKSGIYIVYVSWYRGQLTVNVQKASVSQSCQHWDAMQVDFLTLKQAQHYEVICLQLTPVVFHLQPIL